MAIRVFCAKKGAQNGEAKGCRLGCPCGGLVVQNGDLRRPLQTFFWDWHSF